MNLVTLPWAEFREVRRRTTWVPMQAKHSGKQVSQVWEDFSTTRILCKQNICNLKWPLIYINNLCNLLVTMGNGRNYAAIKKNWNWRNRPWKSRFLFYDPGGCGSFYHRALLRHAAPICARRPEERTAAAQCLWDWDMSGTCKTLTAALEPFQVALLSRLTAAQRC